MSKELEDRRKRIYDHVLDAIDYLRNGRKIKAIKSMRQAGSTHTPSQPMTLITAKMIVEALGSAIKFIRRSDKKLVDHLIPMMKVYRVTISGTVRDSSQLSERVIATMLFVSRRQASEYIDRWEKIWDETLELVYSCDPSHISPNAIQFPSEAHSMVAFSSWDWEDKQGSLCRLKTLIEEEEVWA